jgi:osmotically-inducible protein OsmY
MKAGEDDTTILNDVQNSPSRHPDLETGPVAPPAHRGTVERIGGMAAAPAYTTAVDVVRHIEGIADATNGLDNVTTEPAPVSDQELARKIMLLLGRSEAVPFEGIRTEIHNGCVTLLGSVASRAASEEIEQGVQLLSGVHSVINRISIQEIQQ